MDGAMEATVVAVAIENGTVSSANTTPLSQDDLVRLFGTRRDSLFIVVPITLAYIIIFVLGLFGNVCTCIVITRNKSMHTATNYYLFSLAVSDLLLLLSGLPQDIYYVWSKWPYIFGEIFCVLRGLAAETSTNASVLTITSFTVERYVAICHPFLSHTMSKLSRAVKNIVLVWTLSFVFALPQALQFGIREYRGVVMCLQTKVIIANSFEISTFLFFFAPMMLITVLYVLIGMRLSKSRFKKRKFKVSVSQAEISSVGSGRDAESATHFTHRAVGTVGAVGSIHKRHGQSSRRVVKMLVAVVVAFFVCWAPFHAQRLVAIYGTSANHQARSAAVLLLYGVLTYLSGVLYYLSTAVNPILYQIMSHKFREAFKNTLGAWCGGRAGSVFGSAGRQAARSPALERRNTAHSSTDVSGLARDDATRVSQVSLKQQNSSKSLLARKSSSALKITNNEKPNELLNRNDVTCKKPTERQNSDAPLISRHANNALHRKQKLHSRLDLDENKLTIFYSNINKNENIS